MKIDKGGGGAGVQLNCSPVSHGPGLVAGVSDSGEASDQTLRRSSCSSPECVESPESSACVENILRIRFYARKYMYITKTLIFLLYLGFLMLSLLI